MKKSASGQALLSLLVFMIVAIVITTGAIILLVNSSLSTSRLSLSSEAYYLAETGAEDGVLKLLRDPTYTGESTVYSQGSVEVTVQGDNPYTLTSEATMGTFLRKVQVEIEFQNNEMSITSWKEVT